MNQNSLEEINPDAHHYDAATMERCYKYHNVSEYHAYRNLLAKPFTFFFYSILSYKTNPSFLHGIFNGHKTYPYLLTLTEIWFTDS